MQTSPAGSMVFHPIEGFGQVVEGPFEWRSEHIVLVVNYSEHPGSIYAHAFERMHAVANAKMGRENPSAQSDSDIHERLASARKRGEIRGRIRSAQSARDDIARAEFEKLYSPPSAEATIAARARILRAVDTVGAYRLSDEQRALTRRD